MGRLPGFDYKRPFYYMVTLKRVRVLQPPAPAGGTSTAQTRGAAKPLPFCTISEDGKVVANAITEAFEAAICDWAGFWRSVESVSPHVIMPDHLHLLIKLAAVEKAVTLPVVVGDLRKRLNRAYWQVLQPPAPAGGKGAADAAPCTTPVPPILEESWHDWIVKKEGQLAAFRAYILENPPRLARRRANRRFFTQARQITFRGARYWAYGNEALLELPMIVAIKGHRRGTGAADAAPCKTNAAQTRASAKPGGPVQNQVLPGGASAPPMNGAGLMAAASRIGPGGAGLSTFLSPLEKEAGNEIIKAGGSLIVLSMLGFGERWHPTEKQERLCAAGRMLYLSPYEPQAAKLDKKEMYIRAHALVDWALEHSNEHLEAWP